MSNLDGITRNGRLPTNLIIPAVAIVTMLAAAIGVWSTTQTRISSLEQTVESISKRLDSYEARQYTWNETFEVRRDADSRATNEHLQRLSIEVGRLEGNKYTSPP